MKPISCKILPADERFGSGASKAKTKHYFSEISFFFRRDIAPNETVRDRFVCGINEQKMLQKLLSISNARCE